MDTQLPVDFHGWVYMDFNTDCRIYAARAYANVPDEVLDYMVQLSLPGSLTSPECKALPIGAQKRAVSRIDARAQPRK